MEDAEPLQRKRHRATEPTSDDILLKGRETWGRDPQKVRSTMTEDGDFWEHFRCGALIALQLWNLSFTTGTVPDGGTLMNLLWTLMFLNVCPKSSVLSRLCDGTDPKTIRKHLWGKDADIGFIEAIANLEPFVASCVVCNEHT